MKGPASRPGQNERGGAMDDQNEVEATTEMEPTDDRICDLLAEGWTHERIGAEVGVSTKTIQPVSGDRGPHGTM